MSDSDATIDPSHQSIRPGVSVDDYKILSVLGEGGFGVVYLAERERPVKRRVALKVIKPGMDSRQIVARFEAERQALAVMDHTNVAKVFDAGMTDAGRSYFVMEYVKGVPITEHCDRQRLEIRDRARLFIEVCEAVQHAHQKGIIHRDLKPKNILVAFEGNRALVKVIDFGVAKAMGSPLTDKTLHTEQGQMIGTPEYMSPEQAEMTNQDIDTRSDIYSLGVVLYELLSGSLPFSKEYLRQGGFDRLRRVIREEEPPTPSTQITSLNAEKSTHVTQARDTRIKELKRELQGELDWIVLKAMEKDRQRRYETASGLAMDIRRYLDDEPILARPPSSVYRLSKLVNRNRAVFLTVGSVAAAILVGLVAAIWGLTQANEQRRLAQSERETAIQERRVADQARQKATSLANNLASQAETLRRAKYTAEMNAAYQAWRDGNIGHASALVQRQMPEDSGADQRGSEWYLLSNILRQSDVKSLQFPSSVKVIRFSPDGASLVVGLWNGLIERVDLRTFTRQVLEKGFQLESTFAGSPRIVHGIAFTPDGEQLAVVGGYHQREQSYAKIWRGNSLVGVPANWHHDHMLLAVAISSDGNAAATAGWDRKVKVWNLRGEHGELIKESKEFGGAVSSVAFSKRGLLAASGLEGTIKLYAGPDLVLRDEFKADGTVHTVSFSPNEETLVAATGRGTLFWDISQRPARILNNE